MPSRAAGANVPERTELLFAETQADHVFVKEEQMMPFLPIVRVKSVEEGIRAALEAEHNYRHTSIIHSHDVEHMTAMARALDTTLFVKNGPCMAGLGLIADRPTGLKSPEPAKQFDITISTHSTQTDTAAAWERQLQSPASANAAVRRTSAWWHEFWNRSWILLDNNAPGVTEAYVLQRWVTACAGRGNYPIKFNGSIFTVDPKHVAGGPDYNADWRRWGDCY